MKEKLLEELIEESNGDIETFFDELNDYSYRELEVRVLVKLLNIKNKRIRFKALETITHPLIEKKLIFPILSLFENVKTELGAFMISWVALDENLKSNSLYKYFLLLDKMVELPDEKAVAFGNIFTNGNMVNLTNQEYYEHMNECMIKPIDELQQYENKIYGKKLKR